MIHEGHYLEFARLAQAQSGWKGSIPSAWVRSLPNYTGGDVPERHLKRAELRAFCQSASNSSEACFVACMAWGGMDRRNGAKALGVRSALLAMIDGIRRGGISRTEAYDRFHSAVVPGLAPAYFTKLIHFMRPEGDGYILDQWTGKSVALLFGPGIVAIRQDGWVHRANDARIYGRYCDAVDQLAQRVGVTGEVAEEMMFSRGGRTKQPWRQYVIRNWKTERPRLRISKPGPSLS